MLIPTKFPLNLIMPLLRFLFCVQVCRKAKCYTCEKDLDTSSKSFSSFLNVLAVSINVACNSENQCFDDAKLLLIHYHSKYFYLFRQKNYVNVYNKNMSVTI